MNIFGKFVTDYARLLTAFFFAVVVGLVWYGLFPHILMQHEQSSLFLWEWTFVAERLSMPGGLFSLVGAFVSQFFYRRLLGAVVMALLAFAVQALMWVLLRRVSRTVWLFGLSFVPAIIVACLPFRVEGGSSEEMRCDYLLRQGKWEQLVAMAAEDEPTSAACFNAFQLARCQMGVIDRQTLAVSVSPCKEALSGRTSAFIMSEVYLHLGLVAMSQRCAFEAMESIDDYNKSPRALQRLAVTALVCRQPELASKYLLLLSKTLFYREWALRTLPMALHPERVATHPMLEKLQQTLSLSDDRFFE
ncbi:MAG: DUF6057 family protein [Prevotella sp.]|nr:DUF6057 family protein [Prevotella sp.]